MKREEQLKYCKKCINRKLDMQVGLLCNLTGEKANFEIECSSFSLDETVIEKIDDTQAMEHQDVLAKLSDTTIAKFKLEQNYSKALISGVLVGFLCAILWGIITVVTGYQIAYMAIAIGAAVGYTIRITGKGIDQIFGITGAIIAVLSCLLGNFLSIIGYLANYESLGYFETLELFDYSQLIPIMSESFSFIDVLFYGFAAYEGYKFAFKSFTEKEIYELEK
ncbi:hypothetical protein [uncultured Maribacter sp.]|uniref:hypothetical protein n=1 Tax=uncultured Maribacter sp. TaxID=431308 RepID=UPI002616B448|nr:hypothetical protein [uncultured Maribacter sp.]